MNKLLFVALLFTLTLAADHMAGGWAEATPDELSSEMFEIATNVARTTFAEEHNGVLGEVQSVSKQVVAGVNYKIIFES